VALRDGSSSIESLEEQHVILTKTAIWWAIRIYIHAQ